MSNITQPNILNQWRLSKKKIFGTDVHESHLYIFFEFHINRRRYDISQFQSYLFISLEEKPPHSFLNFTTKIFTKKTVNY